MRPYSLKKPFYNFLFQLILTCHILTSSGAIAFIGGDINEFKDYFHKSFTYNKSSKNKDFTHCYFFLNSEIKNNPQVDGFNAAMTISLKLNKIIGESLVIDLGKNKDTGLVIATSLLMDLILEARQTKTPSKSTLDTQFILFKQAITDALTDNPQTLNYNHENIVIRIEQIDFHKILITITKPILENSPPLN